MKLSVNKIYVALLAAMFVIPFLMFTIAYANPFFSASKARTALATTTVSFLTPGTGTTTPVYDSYEVNGTNQTNQGNISIPDFVAVAMQGNASSTATVLNVACEFSDDGTDYYQNEIYPATTTGALMISAPITFTMTFASSTVGGAAFTTTNVGRYQKLVLCPVPLRYVRAVITNLGAGASLWATIIPTKQRP